MTDLGYGTAGWGIEMVPDAGELDNELMDRGMDIRIISLGSPAFEIDGFDRSPKTLAVSPAVGEGSCHAYGADSVELISIVEYVGFKRGWFRVGAETMGRDGLGYLLDAWRGMTSQNLPGSSGCHHRMVDASCLCMTAINVVQQHGCSQNV
jgi:hypothetical protein